MEEVRIRARTGPRRTAARPLTWEGGWGYGFARDRQTQAHDGVHVVPQRIQLSCRRGVLGLGTIAVSACSGGVGEAGRQRCVQVVHSPAENPIRCVLPAPTVRAESSWQSLRSAPCPQCPACARCHGPFFALESARSSSRRQEIQQKLMDRRGVAVRCLSSVSREACSCTLYVFSGTAVQRGTRDWRYSRSSGGGDTGNPCLFWAAFLSFYPKNAVRSLLAFF